MNTCRTIEKIVSALDCIPRRLRRLNQDRVEALAESMAAIGQINPVHVVCHGEGSYRVVAGAHRIAAAVKLDWDSIDAIFVDDLDDVDRQLVEIDENLARAELSTAERDQHLLRRKQLWEQRQTRWFRRE